MSSVPGSLFRKILFWAHLSCGVTAGILIFTMSATGILLTYERQMIAGAARNNNVEAPPGQAHLSLDEIADAARAAAPDNPRLSLVIDADPAVPVSVTAGRDTVALLNPYTGERLADVSTGTRGFFSKMRSWHRWLGGNSNSPGAKLIDYANLLFVFITVSGLYLWLPHVWRWRTVRGLVLFQKKYINAKVRDFSWHHVFGVWMLVPLFLISLSGAVISFPWATGLIYAAFGEQAPQQQRGGGGGPGGGSGGNPSAGERRGPPPGAVDAGSAETVAAAPRASLQQLLDAAIANAGDWQRITLPLAPAERVELSVVPRSTEFRPPQRTVVLNAADASLLEVQGAAANPSRAQRARTWFRFVHTGEQYGIVGQTIAGIASLAACFLVYTGLALAWRRLIVPLYRRHAA